MPYTKFIKDLQIGDIINQDKNFQLIVMKEPNFLVDGSIEIIVKHEKDNDDRLFQLTSNPYQIINVSDLYYDNKKMKFRSEQR